jgi:hypothetical protein
MRFLVLAVSCVAENGSVLGCNVVSFGVSVPDILMVVVAPSAVTVSRTAHQYCIVTSQKKLIFNVVVVLIRPELFAAQG